MKATERHDFCDECQLAITRLSRDQTMLICDGCSLPKPIPHALLPAHIRLAEARRLKSFQSARN